MNEERKAFIFGDFKLDLSEKMLFRDGSTVPITPKMFETLVILVENAGKIVEKDDLMRTIWHDRFVEENNLTFNIKMLRKTLGDDARNPKFIETIARRGYRFVAELRPAAEVPSSDRQSVSVPGPSFIFGHARMLVVALMIAAITSIVYATLKWKESRSQIPLVANEFNLVKLTNTGSVAISVISPDGRFIAYTSEESRKQSVWLREIVSGKTTVIIPASAEFVFYGLKFSRDGNDLFFAARAPQDVQSIYRIAIDGGTPAKLISNTQGHFSIAPDSSKIAFIRYDKGGRQNKVLVSDLDGRNEKPVRESDLRMAYWTVEFSPDGKEIGVAYGHTDSGSREMSLMAINLENNDQRAITPRKFFAIKSIGWLNDRRKLVMSAADRITDPIRLWEVDYVTGESRPLTFDSQSYSQLSLSRENDKLSTAAVFADFYLYSGDSTAGNGQQRLTRSNLGFAYTKDGRIVFAIDSDAGSDLWMMDSDGSNRKQISSDRSLNGYPIVSADGDIYFTSNRTGEMQVWRMASDGGEQTQITKENGGFPAFVSPDGRMLYYQRSHTGGIWQVPTDGGDESEVIAEKSLVFLTFSHDGKFLAFAQKDKSGGYRIDLMDIAAKVIIKSFPTPDNALPSNLSWIPETNSFSYVLDKDLENDSLWIQDIAEDAPKFAQDLGSEEINDCKFAPDGKNYTVIRGRWRHDAVLLTGLR